MEREPGRWKRDCGVDIRGQARRGSVAAVGGSLVVDSVVATRVVTPDFCIPLALAIGQGMIRYASFIENTW
ncbi:hypothetical protein V6N12_070365 [Hibiscus sabdariffa]|uniref:Uncharacterized protein n=1 Tax=Hibiscus sabdariffa TaxID=183260 RepID=A0ABR2FGK7_9ROSI